jgi:hypothetical protein
VFDQVNGHSFFNPPEVSERVSVIQKFYYLTGDRHTHCILPLPKYFSQLHHITRKFGKRIVDWTFPVFVKETIASSPNSETGHSRGSLPMPERLRAGRNPVLYSKLCISTLDACWSLPLRKQGQA